MVRIHVANDDDDEQSWYTQHLLYKTQEAEGTQKSKIGRCIVHDRLLLAKATSLITFEAWLHWKANHVPSNCLCATRLNFIWLVTSRPFTTLTESVLFDAWFFVQTHNSRSKAIHTANIILFSTNSTGKKQYADKNILSHRYIRVDRTCCMIFCMYVCVI